MFRMPVFIKFYFFDENFLYENEKYTHYNSTKKRV